jgi:hypothetical protein
MVGGTGTSTQLGLFLKYLEDTPGISATMWTWLNIQISKRTVNGEHLITGGTPEVIEWHGSLPSF